jgi:hypothetical protein
MSEICFSKKIVNLFDLFEKEKILPDIERINMYRELLEMTNEEKFYDIFSDVLESSINYYNELLSLNKFEIIFIFENFLKKYTVLHQKKTIFHDPHNVHSFSNQAKKIALNLIEKYPSKYFRPEEFEEKEMDFFFLDIENEEFNEIKLSIIFASVWKFINLNIDKKELKKRLVNEILDSKDVCLSGKFIRIVNVVCGFTEKDKIFLLKMEEQIYNKSYLFHHLNKLINIFDIKNFTKQVQFLINSKIDLKDISCLEILSILNSYTKTEWVFENNQYQPINY